MSDRDVLLTGPALSGQAYGGITRYIIKLAIEQNQILPGSCRIQSPFYISEYLRESRRQLLHRGVYMPFKLPQRIRLAKGLSKVVTTFSKRWTGITHEMFFDTAAFARCRGPKVATFYDLIDERFNRGTAHLQGLLKRKREIAERADHLIAISHATKRDMVEFYGIDESKVSVVHLATDLHDLGREPIAQADELIALGPYLFWVGSRGRYKNFIGFLDAYQHSRCHREGIRVVCAGGSAITDQERQAWADRGLDPKLFSTFWGEDPGLARLYRHAVAFVYPSLYEGFGIPPLEAMCCGCPTAVSSASSIPEVVGGASLMFDPDDTEQMRQSVDRLAFDSTVREQHVRLGLERSREFSWHRCAAETIQVYSRLG